MQPTQPALSCGETATFNDSTCTWDVFLTELEPVDTLPNITRCDSYILPMLANGDYFTETGGTGIQLNSGDEITISQTVYVFAQTGTAPNCFIESEFYVTINSSSNFNLTDNNLDISDQDLNINMIDSSINYEYSVDDSNYQSSNTFFSLSPGGHTLFVSDGKGCVIKSIPFTIIKYIIPKFFTPNSDGYHDTWQVSDPQNTIKSIHVFDRYGKILKKITPQSLNWDGTYKGKLMPVNDYWYLILLKSGKEVKGNFTLKR